MVSTDQAASKAPLMKPDLDEIKRTAMAQAFPQYAAVNNAAAAQTSGTNGEAETLKDASLGPAGASDEINEHNSNGVALNGYTPPAGYSQTGDFVGAPPLQVNPNAANPGIPPPHLAKSIPCRFWPNCRYGDACAFAHDAQLAQDDSPTPQGPPIPALPTPQDSPAATSPAQMQPLSPISPQYQYPMTGYYYPFPPNGDPSQQMPPLDYYSTPPQFMPMHPSFYQPNAHYQQHSHQDPRFAPYPYQAYPNEHMSLQQQHSGLQGVPTAPRAQQQVQSLPQLQPQSPTESRSSPLQQPNGTPSPSSAEQLTMHTFFQTSQSSQQQPYMAENGLHPRPMANTNGNTSYHHRNSFSSSTGRRSQTMPGTSPPYGFSGSRNGSSRAGGLKHSFDRPRKEVPCSFFQENRCRNGDSCVFAHILQDGTDAKLSGKDIVGVDGVEGDPMEMEDFKRSESIRRKETARQRQETYPGGFRDQARFPGMTAQQREGGRGRFGQGGGHHQTSASITSVEGLDSFKTISKEAQIAARERSSSSQRIPNGADFPALPAAITTPSHEKASFLEASNSEPKIKEVAKVPEQPTEQGSSLKVEEPSEKSASVRPLSFSFASAAARGANAPGPAQTTGRKPTPPRQTQSRAAIDSAPPAEVQTASPVAIAV